MPIGAYTDQSRIGRRNDREIIIPQATCLQFGRWYGAGNDRHVEIIAGHPLGNGVERRAIGNFRKAAQPAVRALIEAGNDRVGRQLTGQASHRVSWFPVSLWIQYIDIAAATG